jgi:hypothetical protein
MVGLAEMGRHPVAQVGAGPGATAIPLGLETTQDHRRQGCLLSLGQPALGVSFGAVVQTGQFSAL